MAIGISSPVIENSRPARRRVRPSQALPAGAKDFVADLALCTQPVQRLALGGDRTQPQLVVLGRSLRCALALGDLAGGRKLLAHRCCGARRVAVEAVERRLYDCHPCAGEVALGGAVVLETQFLQQRSQGKPLDDERAEHHAKCAQHDHIDFGIELKLRMAISAQETLQPQHVAVVGAADNHRAACAGLQEADTPQNERAHDPLAQLRLGH
jgi:hypothetical protein